MRRAFLILLLCFLLLSLLPASNIAQDLPIPSPTKRVQFAGIHVMVAGLAAQPVPNASVSITPRDIPGQSVVKGITNKHGRFIAGHLLPGAYDISVEAQGYKPVTQSNLEIRGAQRPVLPFQLLVTGGPSLREFSDKLNSISNDITETHNAQADLKNQVSNLSESVRALSTPSLAYQAPDEVHMMVKTSSEATTEVAAPSVATTLGVGSSSTNRPKPLADYIPCLFDRDDDAALRGQVNSSRQIREQLDQFEGAGMIVGADSKQIAENKKKLMAWLRSTPRDQFGRVVRFAIAQGLLQVNGANAAEKDLAASAMAQALVDSVSKLAQGLPPNVGCSQSLLEWREASDAFNRNIANLYLVYQVIVRNMDSQNEFLIHDVQIAINDSRFFGARDKLIARGPELQGQSMDPRNFTIRLLQALAGMGSSMTVAFPHHDFANGVSIFTAGILPGLSSIFPDRSIDKLNRFNDMSFASSNSYKILVPKSGSVTFVTYVPAKFYAPGYKNWSSADLQNLQEGSYVVVAGAHVNEQPNTATVTDLTCDLKNGALDYSTATNGIVTCQVKGTNLARVKSLRLIVDSTMPHADGTVSISGDTTKGKVEFAVKDLQSLTGTDYKVEILDSTGSEAGTDLTVKIAPAITAINPTSLELWSTNCTTDGTCAFTLTGQNLNAFTAVTLGAARSLLDVTADPTSRTGHFNFADVRSLTTGKLNLMASIGIQPAAQTGVSVDVYVVPAVSTAPASYSVGDTGCQSGSTCDLTLTGSRLDAIGAVGLFEASGTVPVAQATSIDPGTSGNRVAHFAFDVLNALAPKKSTYAVKTQVGDKWYATGKTLSLAPKAP